MKWVLRTLVFGFALIVGVGCAGLIDTALYQDRSASVEKIPTDGESPQAIVSSTGVRVTYEGWDPGTSEMQPYLKFRIYNDTWETLNYRAHSPEGLFAQLTLNGERVQAFHCGTGMTEHYLLPGDSVVVSVSRYELPSATDTNDLITAGFYLRRPFATEYSIYRSASMTLPEEFRIAIETR